jgi:glutathione S-transferase
MPIYTPMVTLLAVALYFFFATQVARGRRRFGVPLPAISGEPRFERLFRVHVNTLEWMPTFLVSLWLCAVYLSDTLAAGVGLVWVAGRIAYFIGYSRAVNGRVPGFFIQSAACVVLFIGAAVGVYRHWAGG